MNENKLYAVVGTTADGENVIVGYEFDARTGESLVFSKYFEKGLNMTFTNKIDAEYLLKDINERSLRYYCCEINEDEIDFTSFKIRTLGFID